MNQEHSTASSSTDYRAIRIEKLNRLREMNMNPYPDRFETTYSLKEARELPDQTRDVKIAGRIYAIRIMGKLSFVTLGSQDFRYQIAVERDYIGEDFYNNIFKKLIDVGDFVGCIGETFTTQKQEPTLKVKEMQLLSKSLRALPEKFHGITDQETIYRQRYLDLIMNQESYQRFKLRSRVISVIRRFLEDHSFDEVETPVLQNKPSGALATPFKTHHNALDIDIYLRIAPETYLKRCIVAGYERVFEFARCFRNEGMDPSHLQDFTMLEYYCAYWNYEDNMRFTEKLIQHVLQEVFGKLVIEIHGETVDFSGSWKKVSFIELFREHLDIDLLEYKDEASFLKMLKSKGIDIEDSAKMALHTLIDQVYKKVIRPGMVQPQFLIGHPIELSPLARRNDRHPEITDRFQLVVKGWEIVNAYSELVDPLDQYQRLEKQAAAKKKGDEEAMVMDEDYITTMEYGMPPISGWGMGIDRFVTLLTSQKNLRDVVLFPLMRVIEK